MSKLYYLIFLEIALVILYINATFADLFRNLDRNICLQYNS